MGEAPKPSSWPSSFFGACLSILLGCIALYAAVELIRRVAVVLVISGLIVFTAWLVWTWRRKPPSTW